MAVHPSGSRYMIQWTGLFAGPILAALVFTGMPRDFRDPAGELVSFTPAGRATLAMMAWMAAWWLTEAIDIAATALLPLALFPVLGIATIGDAARPYANPLIFLFLGGFILALSMQRWGLDRRIALITLRLVGTRPTNMVGGFMIATAVLSAFVSNTATAAMMLPIAVSVIDLMRRQRGLDPGRDLTRAEAGDTRNFALCLMLGVAYAASIGGIATIIGTPPNGILVAFMRDQISEPYQRDISFARWMMIGFPFAAIFLPITWLLLTRFIYPIRLPRLEGGRTLIQEQYRALGAVKRGEWASFLVFCGAALLWIGLPLLQKIDLARGEEVVAPFAGLSDAGVAMIAALALFVIPVDSSRRTFAMDWETARQLPWGILILFGGGLSLAEAVKDNGVAEFLGSRAAMFGDAPPVLLVLVIAAAVIFLTELTSNTATTATLVPILAALAPGLGVHPYLLIVPAALAASCAFMMPVATPPNAIVFGSGHVTIPQMCRAGLWLNLVGIVLVTVLMFVVVKPVLL